MSEKVVLIIGTGTIGEPLITLFTRLRKQLGVDKVYFHKHTPLLRDKTKVVQLLNLGARLCVTSRKKANEFRSLGLEPECMINEALNKATVVIDCTPSGTGISNKEQFYEIFTHNTSGFIAQGSESGFGQPYAYNVNETAFGTDGGHQAQFVQVVSCNTHNMACILKTLAFEDERPILSRANFVCIRRATDISQYDKYIAAPTVGQHKSQRFGTHHAEDVHRLFSTLGHDLNVFSSAIKIPTQYMHIVQFRLKLTRKMSIQEVTERLKANPLIATTAKLDTGTVFSFARDHSPICGRILNQAIVPLSTLHVEGRQIMGYSFTSQDGNSLLSSVVAAERFLYPDTYKEKIQCLDKLVFEEV